MQMKSVVVDKIGSIAQACGLGHELRVATTDIPCEEGEVLVEETLAHKQTHPPLDLQPARTHQRPHGQGVEG